MEKWIVEKYPREWEELNKLGFEKTNSDGESDGDGTGDEDGNGEETEERIPGRSGLGYGLELGEDIKLFRIDRDVEA